MTAEEQARELVREAKAERPLSLLGSTRWSMPTSGLLDRARRRELLIALQELAGHLDPLQFAILEGRIAVF